MEEKDGLSVNEDLTECGYCDGAGPESDDELDDDLHQGLNVMAECGECNETIVTKSTTKRRLKGSGRSSDSEMKKFADEFLLSEVDLYPCNPSTCKVVSCVTNTTGQCCRDVRVGDVCQLRRNFWGDIGGSVPTTKERSEKILTHLRDAHSKNAQKKFTFKVGDVEVCESAFLILLGLSVKPNASDAPSQWRNHKRFVEEGEPSVLKITPGIPRLTRKLNDAIAYIKYVADMRSDFGVMAGIFISYL